MLDVRPTHWITPLKEQPLDDLKPVVHVENLADEDCIVCGLVRIYRQSTASLIFTSVLLPTRIAGYQSANIPTESAWSPAAPANQDYFIICETKAVDIVELHACNANLTARFFDIKPGPMGPAPAAHAPTHARGGMDELEVEDLATDSLDAGYVLTSVGDGSIRFSAPTGGAGTPSDTVTPETTPGLSPNPGTATTYSRGDHTHGTPAGGGTAPTLAICSDMLDPLNYGPYFCHGSGNEMAQSQGTPTANHPGVTRWTTTGSTSGKILSTSATGEANVLLAGTEETNLFVKFDDLSTAHASFFGFHLIPYFEAGDGAYIRIIGAEAGGRCTNGGATSDTATTTTLAPSTWYHLQVKANTAGTAIDFYIYYEAGATIWHDTLTTHLPASPTCNTFTATFTSTSGTGIIDVDRIDLTITRSLVR